jgi:hypothetical protein
MPINKDESFILVKNDLKIKIRRKCIDKKVSYNELLTEMLDAYELLERVSK